VLAEKDPAHTIVHVHTWTKALSPFALAAAARLGFPVAVTLHDFFIACPNGGFFEHGANVTCTRTPLSASCWACSCDRRNYGHKLWRNARTLLQNGILRVPERVARYIAVSQFSLDVLRPHLPAAVPVRVVRNPVVVEKLPPAAVAENRDFLFIGRFEVEKGVSLFADAVRVSGLPAVFIGDGALRPAVERTSPGSEFTGWLAPAEIRRRLQTARAVVFPPLWHETLGLVAIEAAAAGVPTIVSDRCAATDHIRDGVQGLWFPHGSAAGLARQMSALARDNALAARLGQAAYDWYWRDPWTVESHVSALMEIYGELAAANAPATGERIFYEGAGGLRAGS